MLNKSWWWFLWAEFQISFFMKNTVCKFLTAKIVYQILERNAFRQENSIRQLEQTNISTKTYRNN